MKAIKFLWRVRAEPDRETLFVHYNLRKKFLAMIGLNKFDLTSIPCPSSHSYKITLLYPLFKIVGESAADCGGRMCSLGRGAAAPS